MHILLVEDNAADAYVLSEVFSQKRGAPEIHWVKNGHDALNYVFKKKPYEEAVRPDLILLDLNIPRVSGHGVLKELKETPVYSAIPIVILTASINPLDHTQCKVLGADMCLSKPHGLKEYDVLVQKLMDWGKLRHDPKAVNDNKLH